MTDWTQTLKAYPLDWLMASNASVRYLTLRYLLDVSPDDLQLIQAQHELQNSPLVTAFLEGQYPNGYWGRPERYFAQRYTGTAFRWLTLLHMGVDSQLEVMQRAANFLVKIAYDAENGGFKGQPETSSIWCYGGWLMWGYFLSDMGDHPHVRSALDWTLRTMLFNDGVDNVDDPDYFCLGRHTCVRAVVPVLRMLSVLPEYLRSETSDAMIRNGVDWVLAHNVYQRSHNPPVPMNAKLTQLTFPDFTFPDFVDILQMLLDLGIHDPRMESAITYLRKKQRKDGMWKVQREFNDRGGGRKNPTVIKLGVKGQPGPWVTFKSLRVLKEWEMA